MKFLTFLLVCASAACAWAEVEITKEKVVEIAKVCKQETGASDADMKALLAHQPSDNMPSKCMRACFLKKFEMTGADGQLLKPRVLAYVKYVAMGDASKEALGDKIAEACADIKLPSDACEAGVAQSKCLLDQLEANKFKRVEY